MTDPLTQQKENIRKQCRQIRSAMNKLILQRYCQEICAAIENWYIFKNAEVILTYMPIKSEVNLRPLIDDYPHKKWVLPRIIPEADHRLALHRYMPDQLNRHPFGMDEPSAGLPMIAPSDIELALIPGLAYDRAGWRLGYGGGYYDRLLTDFPGYRVGAVFQALLFDQLPHGGFDQQMDWVVTEDGFWPRINHSAG